MLSFHIAENDDRILDAWTPGRITGSSSIETLVRIGLEKESGISNEAKMVVLHDFIPCVDDELEVKRGNIVTVLYQENDWVYVIAENNQEGFIPHSYCAPVTSQLAQMVRHKKLPRNPQTVQAIKDGLDNNYTHTGADIHPFFKDPVGRYVALYSFEPREENDVSVDRGEFVTVLNKEDPDWFWVCRSDSEEGFVPSSFLCPMDVTAIKNPPQEVAEQTQQAQNQVAPPSTVISGGHQVAGSSSTSSDVAPIGDTMKGSGITPAGSTDTIDSVYRGVELVMLFDYKAQVPNDLTIRRGEWIYADLTNQTVEGWLWAYAPKQRRYGFIPKAWASTPAMSAI